MDAGQSNSAGGRNWRQWNAQGSRQQRVGYWNDVVCQAVLDVDMTPVEPRAEKLFVGSIHSLNQAGARFISFRSSGHCVTRTTHQADRADDQYLMISLQCSGDSHVTQRRGGVHLGRGDIGIVDSSLPFEVKFPNGVDRRIVMMPKRLLSARLPSAANLNEPRRIGADYILMPVLAQTVRTLTERKLPLDDATAHTLLESLADLLARTLAGVQAPAAERLGYAMFEDILHYVARNLGSPALSPASAAAQAGISLRTLHRLFQRFGDTGFEQYVIEKRLLLAQRSLASGASTGVTEAAFSSGFNDLSHFTRRFTQRFGVKPSSLVRRKA